jgi:hypothetical protein
MDKNTKILWETSKEICTGVREEKTKYAYMLMSCQQTKGQKVSIKVANKAFEYIAKFIYFGTARNKNCIH